MKSACRNPGPTNECTGLEGKFVVMEKIKNAILDLIRECGHGFDACGRGQDDILVLFDLTVQVHVAVEIRVGSHNGCYALYKRAANLGHIRVRYLMQEYLSIWGSWMMGKA